MRKQQSIRHRSSNTREHDQCEGCIMERTVVLNLPSSSGCSDDGDLPLRLWYTSDSISAKEDCIEHQCELDSIRSVSWKNLKLHTQGCKKCMRNTKKGNKKKSVLGEAVSRSKGSNIRKRATIVGFHRNPNKTFARDRLFKCLECGKRFARRGALKIHRLCHEKPVVCPECGKNFCESDFEKNCLREKTFKCPHCGKKFTKFHNSKHYQSKYTHEKPFECLECRKRFVKSEDLEFHHCTHSEKRVDQEIHIQLSSTKSQRSAHQEKISGSSGKTYKRHVNKQNMAVWKKNVARNVAHPTKSKILDSVELPQNHDKFFKHITPSLELLNEDQILQFQIGVLDVLQKLKRGTGPVESPVGRILNKACHKKKKKSSK